MTAIDVAIYQKDAEGKFAHQHTRGSHVDTGRWNSIISMLEMGAYILLDFDFLQFVWLLKTLFN